MDKRQLAFMVLEAVEREEEMMENNDFISIYATMQEDKIAIIKSLLDSEKIIYYISNENIASRVHNALDRQMHLMVTKDSVKSVKEILKGIITED